ncbi:MAG: hypothetical protein O3A75_03885 [Verrucomicrobia bacterium]|jgi:hypothetical protein|nr:hypothetical protein [Verrucomicrobiota bacterium]MDA1203439.1 hypothetical protein [Verrucomicrobiota bacterium]
MKAKNHPRSGHRTPNSRRDDPLPHELGMHIFALIKRNLLARRRSQDTPSTSQLTFVF